MKITFAGRRRALRQAAALAPLLAGCAGGHDALSAAGTEVVAEAPAYRVGDRWTYRVDQQFRAAADTTDELRIVSIGPEGIVARATSRGGPVDFERTERWPAPGLVLQGAMMDVESRRFAQPLQRFRFPLRAGERWNQWVDQVNETSGTRGPVNRYVAVQRSERVATPAGTFDAVRMSVIMRLDDETPFRYATELSHLVWYAPAVRGVVREERRGEYREKGSGRDGLAYVPAQREIVELLAFAPGP
ncbi:MAG: hypothetical protein BroJett026_14940 [Betaproteobacteria bacterium]|nr:MAG: hypothetical protein BroJett026_14940 [Betaproteobacteria bacterium]